MAVPWQIVLLHPLGLTLTFLSTILFILVWMFMMRTPAVTFLKAGLGRRMILINPDPDKRMVFRIAKKESDMAYVKKRGYYITDPNHIYIESSSKIPCAITYGMFSESIDTTGAEFAKQLNDAGIRNYVDIINHFFDEKSAEELFKGGSITKEEYDLAPKKIYRVRKKDVKDMVIHGKSVPFDNIVNYFSKNTRADLIEAKISQRVAMSQMQKLGAGANMIKWAAIIMMVMIGGALAYNMITMSRPVAETQTPPPSETGGVGGIIGQGVEAIGGGTQTGIS